MISLAGIPARLSVSLKGFYQVMQKFFGNSVDMPHQAVLL